MVVSKSAGRSDFRRIRLRGLPPWPPWPPEEDEDGGALAMTALAVTVVGGGISGGLEMGGNTGEMGSTAGEVGGTTGCKTDVDGVIFDAITIHNWTHFTPCVHS